MYTHILVGIDGSDPSRRGFREAIGLAKELGSRLSLVHVVETPYPYDGASVDIEALEEARSAPGRAILDQAVAQARQAGIDAEAVLTSNNGGRVADAITAVARQSSADLIVLGTHGHGLLGKLLGSVAEDVLESTPVPLLFVRATGDARQSNRKE